MTRGMELEVLRFSSQKDSTNGLLFDVTGGKRRFLCYTLEDEHREVKVAGETRIPSGTYRITLRTTGGFHGRYLSKYGEMHKGMYGYVMCLALSISLFILVILTNTLLGVSLLVIVNKRILATAMVLLVRLVKHIKEFTHQLLRLWKRGNR